MTSGRRQSPFLVAVCVVWTMAVFAGLAKMWVYAETPGPPVNAGPTWPGGAHLTRESGTPTLVMFLHPQCDCSRASIEELGVLLARVPKMPVTDVAVYRPAGASPGWEFTSLWASAAAIPGVHVTSDEDGREARLFGALVSGSTLLYAPDGRSLFSGGVTSARGHAGDNAGLDAITSFLIHDGASVPHTPVFGCLLQAAWDAPEPPAEPARRP